MEDVNRLCLHTTLRLEVSSDLGLVVKFGWNWTCGMTHVRGNPGISLQPLLYIVYGSKKKERCPTAVLIDIVNSTKTTHNWTLLL